MKTKQNPLKVDSNFLKKDNDMEYQSNVQLGVQVEEHS